MPTTTVVSNYLEAMASRDWELFAKSLSDEGLIRAGPFMDEVQGKAAYVDFLSNLMPTLVNYKLKVERVSSDNRLVFVELSETFDVDGVSTSYPEIILFEIDDVGKIRFVSVFMKWPGAGPPVEGGSARSG